MAPIKRAPNPAARVMGVHAIHEAVRANDYPRVRTLLLDQPSAIYAADAEQNRPAHIAASCPATDTMITRLLVGAAASMCFCVNVYGEIPLHAAARSGNTDAIAQLTRAANTALACQDNGGNTPLMAAAKAGHADATLRLLEAHPEALFAWDGAGQLPLQIVAQHYCDCSCYVIENCAQYGPVLKAMLALAPWLAAADPGLLLVGGDHEVSVLHMATFLKDEDLVRQVVQIAPAAIVDANIAGDLAIHVAAWMGHADIVRFLLSTLPGLTHVCNPRTELPLHCAASSASEATVAVLLEAAPSTATFFMREGLSPLYVAASHGNLGGARALLQACPSMATMPNATGLLPVYAAAYFGHEGIVDMLMAAAPDTAGALMPLDGLNALHAAAYTCWPRTIDVILQREPQLATSRTADGKTAVQLVLQRDECAVMRDDAAVAGVIAALVRVAPELARQSLPICDAAAHGLSKCALALAAAAPDTAAAGLGAALRAKQKQVACELAARVPAAEAFEALAPYGDILELGDVFVETIKAHLPLSNLCWKQVPRRVPGLLAALPAVLDKGRETDVHALVQRLGRRDKRHVQNAVMALNHAWPAAPAELARRVVGLAV